MHNAQPECLLRRLELFTWAETLFSQCWGGATLQFIKQQGEGGDTDYMDDTQDRDVELPVQLQDVPHSISS